MAKAQLELFDGLMYRPTYCPKPKPPFKRVVVDCKDLTSK